VNSRVQVGVGFYPAMMVRWLETKLGLQNQHDILAKLLRLLCGEEYGMGKPLEFATDLDHEDIEAIVVKVPKAKRKAFQQAVDEVLKLNRMATTARALLQRKQRVQSAQLARSWRSWASHYYAGPKARARQDQMIVSNKLDKPIKLFSIQLLTTLTVDSTALDIELLPKLKDKIDEKLRDLDDQKVPDWLLEFHRWAQRKLTGEERFCVNCVLAKDADYNSVLKEYTRRTDDATLQVRNARAKKLVENAICFSLETYNECGAVALGTVGASLTSLAAVDYANGAQVLGAHSYWSVAASGGISAAAASILCICEAYRWGKGDITGKDAALNCGEHIVGTAAGWGASCYAISSVGFLAGGWTVLGLSVPILGIGIGAALLGNMAARKLYSIWRRWCFQGSDMEREAAEHEARRCAEQVIKDSARYLEIDLKSDSYAEAKKKYRFLLLKTHPDKGRPDEENERNEKTQKLVAHWLIVRKHYEELDESDERRNGMGTEDLKISLMAKYIWDEAKNVWCHVAAWAKREGDEERNFSDDENHYRISEYELFI